MWSNTDKGQLERCDQIQIMVNYKYRLERCDQIQIKFTRKMWSNTERCDQIQEKVNKNDVSKYG